MEVVPEPFTTIDGADPSIEQARTSFFDEVLEELEVNGEDRRAFCEITSYQLRDFSGDTESDDRLSVLIVKDVVVASVLERRNERNQTEVFSASYLTPAISDRLGR